jgi:hypothetical protein
MFPMTKVNMFMWNMVGFKNTLEIAEKMTIIPTNVPSQNHYHFWHAQAWFIIQNTLTIWSMVCYVSSIIEWKYHGPMTWDLIAVQYHRSRRSHGVTVFKIYVTIKVALVERIAWMQKDLPNNLTSKNEGAYNLIVVIVKYTKQMSSWNFLELLND